MTNSSVEFTAGLFAVVTLNSRTGAVELVAAEFYNYLFLVEAWRFVLGIPQFIVELHFPSDQIASVIR